MTATIEALEAALVAAFPPVVIDRAMIDDPAAHWDVYEDYPDLIAFEGKSWREFPAELLWRHSAMLLYAGDALWRAALPGYLLYLLHERQRFNDLPWQVAGQLRRKDDPEYHPKFDRRIAPFSPAQRSAIRDVIAYLTTVPPAEEIMSEALRTWEQLVASEQ